MGASLSLLIARIGFARLAADEVLDRAADAAGDVEVRRDARAGLADLVGVRAPAEVRDDARAADGAAEQRGQLLEDGEALRAADAAAAADDDARVVERRRAAVGLLATRDLDARSLAVERRREVSTPACAGRLRGDGVRRDREQLRRAGEPRLLEQAAAPALPRELSGRRRRARRRSSPPAAASSRAATCAITSWPRSVPGAMTTSAPSSTRSPRPRRRERTRRAADRDGRDGRRP